MANLETLQKEARERIEVMLRQVFSPRTSGATNDFLNEIEDIATHIYTQAIQDAKDAMPGEMINYSGLCGLHENEEDGSETTCHCWDKAKSANAYRTEALTALDALITKEV